MELGKVKENGLNYYMPDAGSIPRYSPQWIQQLQIIYNYSEEAGLYKYIQLCGKILILSRDTRSTCVTTNGKKL